MIGSTSTSRAAGALVTLLLLAACGGAPPPQTVTASGRTPPPAFKIQSFAPEMPGAETAPPPAGTGQPPQAQNDPSAPPDTPLCGVEAREAAQAAAAISPGVDADGGACLAAACFNALTDTYIGADGYRHVCQ